MIDFTDKRQSLLEQMHVTFQKKRFRLCKLHSNQDKNLELWLKNPLFWDFKSLWN